MKTMIYEDAVSAVICFFFLFTGRLDLQPQITFNFLNSKTPLASHIRCPSLNHIGPIIKAVVPHTSTIPY